MDAQCSSVVLQLFSFGSVDLLKRLIGRVVPSLFSCSITVLNPSTDASVTNWNGLAPEMAAAKSGKANTWGLTSCADRACTNLRVLHGELNFNSLFKQ